MNTTFLANLVSHVCEARQELREQGATEATIAQTTERMVRDAWGPLVPDQRFWPVHLTLPKCAYCDGTGLVLRHNVVNRLGVNVTEGEPCRCPRGVRFEEKQKHEDYTDAGKTPPKPTKSWTRAGR